MDFRSTLKPDTPALGGAKRLTFSRQGSPESAALDSLLLIDLDPSLSAFAGRACREYLLHRRPIGLDPSAIMAAVAIGRHSDLSEFQFRAASNLCDVKDGNGVMVRPPAGSTPRLHDLFARLQHQIDSGNMWSPGGESPPNLVADPGWLARQRLMLFRVHEH